MDFETIASFYKTHCFDQKFIRPDSSYTPSDFSFLALLPASFSSRFALPFDAEHNSHAVVLTMPHLRKSNLAFLSLLVGSDTLDCTNVQGFHDRYFPLRQIRWEAALLDSVVSLAEQHNFMYVTLPPAHQHSLWSEDERVQKSLLRHYDATAEHCDFRYDAQRALFVKKI